jgi:hypothetical protein
MIEINNVKFYVFKSSIFTFIVVNIQLSIEINVSIIFMCVIKMKVLLLLLFPYVKVIRLPKKVMIVIKSKKTI